MLDLARINPVEEVQLPVAALSAGVSDTLHQAWRATEAETDDAWDRISDDALQGSTRLTENLRRGFGTMWVGDASEQEETDGHNGE